ncbi:MAG: arylsulfatase A-like enzyme [Myxococcota bacterium]
MSVPILKTSGLPFLRIATLILLGCMAWIGCADAPPERPNIVLVTVDTQRADRLGSYGYPKSTTRFLDSLAVDGIRFERAYSASSWTVPSVVSLLTSLNPTVHGVERGLFLAGEVTQQEAIPESVAVLPELLRERGYTTFGVTANEHLAARFGFDRGFDRYECLGVANADELMGVVARWNEEITASAPYFLWLHLLDPHAPYFFHDSQRDFYGPRAGLVKRFESLTPWSLSNQRVSKRSVKFAALNALYDGEIRHTDTALADIFASLGVDGGDLVIVTSDHGEEMLDHDGFGHGESLFEEVIRVPLIVRFPGGEMAGTTVQSPVRLIDVVPTILEAVGVEVPEAMQGRGLKGSIDGSDVVERDVVASLARIPGKNLKSLTIGEWKYIHDHLHPEADRLFNVVRDPSESKNLLSAESERAQRMRSRLDEILDEEAARRLVAREVQVSSDQVEQLKALGYVAPEASADNAQEPGESTRD